MLAPAASVKLQAGTGALLYAQQTGGSSPSGVGTGPTFAWGLDLSPGLRF